MRPLITKTNVDPAVYPWNYGRSKDNTGLNDGTPLNEDTLGDYIQFFDRMMYRSGLIPNNLVDNGANGWQLHQALLQTIAAYKNIYTYSNSATLTDDNFGSVSYFFSFFAGTFTLPLASINNATKKLNIKNVSSSDLTIIVQGGDTITPSGVPFVLKMFDEIELTSVGIGMWVVNRIYRYVPPPVTVSAFLNSWSAVSTVKYRIDGEGTVTIQGLVTNASLANGVIFNLPVGYRPTSNRYFTQMVLDGAVYVPVQMTVATNGNVSAQLGALTGPAVTVAVDGIVFNID
jgi:hypothetical protein